MDLTGEKYLEFLNYFALNFPTIRAKFPKEIEWSLMYVPYGVRKPADMSDEDFDEFREIEFRWLIANNIVNESPNQQLFVLVKNGITSIDSKTVLSATAINKNSTEVNIRDEHGNQSSFIVFGDVDSVKQKLGHS